MSYRVHYPEEPYLNCTRCGLSESRRRVVLRGEGRVNKGTVEREDRLLYYKGKLQDGTEEGILPQEYPIFPTLLFIGEAPGEAEDATGIPFTGQAGRLFHLALSYCTVAFDFEVTYSVGCRPTKISKRGQIINRPPSLQEKTECLPRITGLIQHVLYDGYVSLGTGFAPKGLTLKNPTQILRKEYKLYDLKEFALKIDNYVKDLCTAKLASEDGG